jgi:mono/diheme cytochrome c family protein
MKSLIWFLLGASAVMSIAGITLFWAVPLLANGFSTRTPPTALESWLARRMRHMSAPETAKRLTNPVADSKQTLDQARAHWSGHCASCHANNGSGDIAMGRQMYPPAPDMRQPETQNLTDGELFYIIQNGIRMTGMPAWGSGSPQDAEDSWKLVRFIRHLPAMTTSEEQQMKEMNPKSPDEFKEEQEERDFLNGADPHEQPQHHPH